VRGVASKRSVVTVRSLGEAGLAQPSLVSRFTLSANGAFALTSDVASCLRVFDLAAGSVRELPLPVAVRAKFAVTGLGISNDGERLIVCGRRGVIVGSRSSWKPTVVRRAPPELPLPLEADAVVMGPSGERSAAIDGSNVFFLEGDRVVKKHWEKGGVTALAGSAGGRLVVACRRGALRLFDDRGRLLEEIEVGAPVHRAAIGFEDEATVRLIGAGQSLRWRIGAKLSSRKAATTEADRLLAPLELAVGGSRPPRALRLESGEHLDTTGSDWSCSADGRTLLCARGATLCRLDASTLTPLGDEPTLSAVFAVGFDGDGGLWAGDDRAFRRWDLERGRLVETHPLPRGHRAAGIAPGAVHAFTVKVDQLHGFELRTGTARPALGALDRNVVCSPDGSAVMVSGSQHALVEVTTQRTLRTWPHRWSACAFSVAGDLLAACTEPEWIVLFETKSGAERRRFRVPGKRPFALAFTPDGTSLALATDGSKVHLVDVRTGRLTLELGGLRRPRVFFPLAISPDGKRLAAADEHHTFLWSLPKGALLHRLDRGARALAFSHDSRRLAVGSMGVVALLEG